MLCYACCDYFGLLLKAGTGKRTAWWAPNFVHCFTHMVCMLNRLYV